MSNNDAIKLLILENAVKYKGTADKKFVFGGVLANHPEYRTKQQELHEILDKLISEINSLDLDTQKQELEKLNPNFFDKKDKVERNIFAFLNIKNGDKVISAFPPSPEKYYHIGHAKAILLNYLLSQKYNGKFYLRFEDTNPEKVLPEFYTIMLEDIGWLGVKWDQVQYASDHMDLFISCAEKLIKENKAYMCFCKPEEASDKRAKGEDCSCRNHTLEENLKFWNEFSSYPEGKAVLRLKIDMKHKNYRMRDPTIFRRIDTKHPRIGDKYNIYPMYDFQNPIMDGYFNITHRLRTVEFEMASELHHYIRNILGLYDTYTYEFSRLNFEGTESSGRVIREKVESGELIGWDDPSLPTLRALKRRGFTPQAITQMVIESGITKSSGSLLTWDTLIKYNKRILNDSSKRFFFIKEPTEILISEDKNKEFLLEMHPSVSLGKRNFKSTGKYYLEKEDVDSFKDGVLVRLMDNINFIYTKKINKFHSEDYLNFKNFKEEKKIIHFLPADKNQLLTATIFMPDHRIIKGIAEKNIQSLKVGEIIQFERFGFCRLDSITEENVYNFWFTH
ncbi:MAG TPA: glutamate--tRNA ligase [archaeon]|nr:glutamate--tRNA ligase [archaeon]